MTKLQTWFSSEETPDVFALASDQLYPYKDSLLFEDLKHYIENDGCSEYWDMDSVEANWKTDDGRIVAAPFVSKTFAIAYNKALFDQAQIPYPTSDWTEKDMLDAAEKYRLWAMIFMVSAGAYVCRNFTAIFTETCFMMLKTKK